MGGKFQKFERKQYSRALEWGQTELLMEKILNHEHGMQLALEQARCALKKGEVPVGALLVDQFGGIVADAFNEVETRQSQLAHAEVLVVNEGSSKLKSWRLNGHWLYVTLEPCLMCLGLIQLSRIDGVCFGSESSLFGTGLGKAVLDISLYEKTIHVVSGIRREECAELLRLFFEAKRGKKKGSL